jgi:predicted nucleic acid-binding protein
MDRFAQKIKSFSLVGLDTVLFIYHFESNPKYLALTGELFTNIETGTPSGLTSTITLLEIIVRPFAMGLPEIASKYETLLVNFPNLKIADIDRDIIRRAARLRAKYGIRPPDALQAAASLVHGAGAFITNDRSLKRLNEELEVITLDDFI